jgi:tetratricopeptide (TPR) repeat protein
MLGAALLSQGFAAEAIPHLERTQTHDLLGVALLECDRARDAVDHLEAALLKRPGDPEILYYLSEAHRRLAKNLLDQLLSSRPESARAHQMLGAANAAVGKIAVAEEHFRAALTVRADLRGVHLALGDLYVQSGDYEKAEAEYRAEVQNSPGLAEAAYKLGTVLLNRGNLPGAVAELRRADELRPGMPDTLVELGKALNASGDSASALKYLEEAVAKEPRSELSQAAQLQLARAYRKLGRVADAERAMKRVREFQQRRQPRQ